MPQDELVPISYGVSTNLTVITPVGGVNRGINVQHFSDGSSGVYSVTGVGVGVDVGADAQANAAIYLGGDNLAAESWAGGFYSGHFSLLGFSVSAFGGGGWYGLSFGATSDGFGLSGQVNGYKLLTDN